MWSDLGRAVRMVLSGEGDAPPRSAPVEPAMLTAANIASFIEASSGRDHIDPLTTDPRALASFARLPRPSTRLAPRIYGDLLADIRRKRPVRVRRLQADFRWLQREAAKRGYSPEEARWLL